MPNKDGIELVLELKRDFPEVKIIAISGGGAGSAESYLQTAEMLEVDLTIAKPFSTEEILQAVKELLK
jgi:DNA-binding NarL/FixJ family response regulator